MKRLLACLLALLLPFTTAMATDVSSVFSAVTAQVNQDAVVPAAEGYEASLNLGDATLAKVFVGVADKALYLKLEGEQTVIFELSAEGLNMWDGSQWYAINAGDMPFAAGSMFDVSMLSAAIEQDLQKLLPVLAPAFSPLGNTSAVKLLGLKLTSMMEKGVFSISGSDLSMVLYEVAMVLKKVDMAAVQQLAPQLLLGELYLQVLEALPDLLEDIAMSAVFQLKGNLSDDEQGFVSLTMDGFAFSLNYREDEDLDLLLVDGVISINDMPLTFDMTIGNDIQLNYAASGARGNITLIKQDLTQTLSLAGSHYIVRNNAERLEAVWSADLAVKEDGFILALDTDENSRSFVELTVFGNDAFNAAFLDYKAVGEAYSVGLVNEGEGVWKLPFTAVMDGVEIVNGNVTARPGEMALPAKPAQLPTLTLEELSAHFMGQPETANP